MFKKVITCIATMLYINLNCAYANPEGGIVAEGSATITTPDAHTVQINQTSDKAIINWNSFNINSDETTRFVQPSTSSIALNRIDPQQGASQIFGQLQANGQIILVNQAGIYFGPSSRVDVAGIIASTSNISDANFLAGNYVFDQSSLYNGAIINQGTIVAAQHGLVALLGSAVSNEGIIQARLGNVVLASGNKFTVGFDNAGLINFTVDEGISNPGIDQNNQPLSNAVSNSGTVIADGGTVLMTAKAAEGVVDHVVNMTGVVQAQTVEGYNGTIIIYGDDVGATYLSGRLDASGNLTGQTGGTINILGKYIHVDNTAVIDASGDAGGGQIYVGGNEHGQGPLPNATVTYIAENASLLANAVTQGNGGKIIVWSNVATGVDGSISARGGANGGDGGFVETSGKEYLYIGQARIDTSSPMGQTGTWLLDPADITISSSSDANGSFSSGTYTPSNGATSSIINVSTLQTQLASNNINITTTSSGNAAGNITVANPITWSSANTLTLTANSTTNAGSGYGSITINSNGLSPMINATGSGSLTLNATAGNITLNGGITLANGTLTLYAQNASSSITTGTPVDGVSIGGAIDVGNFILAAGQWNQNNATLATFSVDNNFKINTGSNFNGYFNAKFTRLASTTTINSVSYNVVPDIYGLQGVATDTLSNKYALTQDIDASSTTNWNNGAGLLGFVPIGKSGYSGTFDGQNYAVNNLYISTTSNTSHNIGLFSDNSGTIKNLRVTNANVNSSIFSGDGDIGILVGSSTGTIQNIYTSGIVTVSAANISIGGAIGWNVGSITDSYSTANVVANFNPDNQAIYIGGFTGATNFNTVSNSYSAGSVNVNLTATTGTIYVGGFTGLLGQSTLTNNYSLTSVTKTGTNSNTSVGGFAGASPDGYGAQLTNAYSTGAISVSGGGTIGGFIGLVGSGNTITSALWDAGTSGITAGYGANSGTINNLYGGCFGNTNCVGTLTNATNNSASLVNLATPAAYTTAGWSTTAGVSGSITSTPSTTSTAPDYTWFIFTNTRPLLLAEQNTTITNVHQLQLMGSTLGASYTLANNIDLSSSLNNKAEIWGTQTSTSSGAGFVPIGNSTTGYSGTFDGQNYTVDNLYINVTSDIGADIGLFGNTSSTSTIQNIGITNASVSTSFASGNSNIGLLVGYSNGNIQNISTSGTVTSTASTTRIGGAIGWASAGTISNSYSTANVVTNNGSSGGWGDIGGFAGAITDTATAINSYSAGVVTAAISGTSDNSIGGFVGTLWSGASNNYSLTPIIKTGSNNSNMHIGGFAGQLNGGTPTNAYSTGAISVSGGGTVGGFVGQILSGSTVTGALWDAGTTGVTAGYGSNAGTVNSLYGGCFGNTSCVGTLTNATNNAGSLVNLAATGTYTNWDFTSTWGIINGYSYPYLKAFYSSTPRAIQGTIGTVGGGKNVTLAANGTVNTTAYTGANNTFYFLVANGAIADSSNLLIYAPNGAGNVLAVAPTSGGSLANMGTATTNAIYLDNSLSATSLSSLATNFIGSLNSTNILFAVSSGNFVLGNGTNTTANLISAMANMLTIDKSITVGGSASSVNFAGPVTFTAASATTTNAQTYSGAVTLNTNTTLTSAAGNISLSSTITGNGNNLTISNTGTSSSISGVFSGTNSSLIKQGSGTLVLNASNTYTGATTISGGTLQLGASNLISNSSTVSVASGAIFNLANFSETIGSLSGAGNVTLGSGVLTAGGDNTSTSFSGVISGTGSVTKAGTGTWTLSGASTYTGATNINAGTLQLGINNGVGSSAVTVASGATFALANFNDTIGSLAGAGNATLGSGTLTTGGNNTSTAFSGIMSGTGSLIKSGTGTFTLSNGSNSYSGGTTINNGTVAISNANALGSSGTVSVATGGTLDTSSLSISRSINLNGGTLTGSGTLSGNLVLDSNSIINGNFTLSGAISGAGGFTKNTAGTLTINAGFSNNYTGATVINAGTLNLNTASQTVLGNTSGVTVALGATLSLNANGLFLPASITLNGGKLASNGGGSSINAIIAGYSITLGADSTIEVNHDFAVSDISGGYSLTKTGGATLQLSGNNTYTGGTLVNGGTLQVWSNLGTGTVTLNGATISNVPDVSLANNIILATSGNIFNLGGTVTLSGTISGANELTKTGSGTLILSGNNTYTGATNLNAGTLRVYNDNGLGDTAGSTTVASGATLQINAAIGAETINLGGALSSIAGGSLAGNIVLGASTTIDTGLFGLTLSGIISQAGVTAFGITKNGTGTLTLAGANTYDGTTAITAGTASVANATGLGSTVGGTTVASGATLEINGVAVGNEAITLNGSTLTGTGTGSLAGNISLTSSSLLNGSGNLTLSGVISGSAGFLTKSGGGTITLSGNNTYTGITNINAGTLSIAHANGLGSTAASTTVYPGATLNINGVAIGNESLFLSGTLTGSGSLAGAIIVGGSGTINNADTLTLSGTLDGDDFSKTGSGDLILSNTVGASIALGAINLNSTGTTTFGSTVSATSLVANSPVVINGASITTSGAQTYTGAVTLGANTTLTSSASGNINLASTINGAYGLTVNTAGTTTFGGVVGGSTALTSLMTDSAGSTTISGSGITTSGAQTYNDTLTLSSNPSLTSEASDITFNGNMNGASHTLTLSGGESGNHIFTLNSITALDTLSINGNPSVNNTLALLTGSGTNTWTVTNDGGSSGSNGTLAVTNLTSGGTFNNIQNLTGGAATNIFIFNSNAAISGNLMGGGNGTLNLSALLNSSINVTANTASSVGGTLSGINNFIGAGSTSTLTSMNGATVYGSNQGTINSMTFNGFGNLSGSGTFTFGSSGSISGNLLASGSSTLDISALSASNVNLTTGTASGIGGTLSGISTFIGSGANSTLTYSNGFKDWNITDNNAGNISSTSFNFTAFGNLIGGSGDTFSLFNDKSIGSISASNGTLNYFSYSTGVTVNTTSNTATNVGNFSGITTFYGVADKNNTFINTSGNNNWNISSTDVGNVSENTFINFANLTGGNNDNFIFASGSSISGNLTGGGNALLDISALPASTVNLTTAQSSGIGGTFSGITTFIGSGASSTLTGPTSSSTWNINSTNSGTVASNTFNGFGNLSGSGTFTFGSSGSISGNLLASGSSTLDISALSASNVNLTTGTASGIGGTFSGITTFIGSGASSTLTGPTSSSTWNINSTNSGTVASNTFSGFGNLSGSGTFTFGSSGSISGNLLASGSSTLDISALSASNVNLTTGTASGIGGTLSGISTFIGSGANSTLTYSNGFKDWNITDNNAGNISSTSFNFTAFGNLIGGSGDTFSLFNDKSIGSISASNGTLNYFSYSTGVTVNTTSNTATNVGNFSGITTFYGVADKNNTFINTSGNNNWNISSTDVGNVSENTFINFANLTGGNNDNFIFASGSSISGNLTGSGNTLLDISALPASTVNLTTAQSSGIGGTFSGITTFIGSGASSTLTGPTSSSTWNINSTNSGTVASNTFNGFGNLIGSTGDNSFILSDSGSVSGSITGGSGTNTLTVNGATNWIISGTNSGTVTGIGNGFSGIQNLVGGPNTNTFTFSGNGKVSTINGGSSGNNLLDYSGYAQDIVLTLNIPTSGNEFNSGSIVNNSSTNIGSFTNVQSARGSNSGQSTLFLPNKTVTVTYTGTNTGFIGDPFYFYNFLIANLPVTNTTTTTIPSTTNVAQVMMPYTQSSSPGVDTYFFTTTPPYASVNQDILQITQQEVSLDEQINKKSSVGCL